MNSNLPVHTQKETHMQILDMGDVISAKLKRELIAARLAISKLRGAIMEAVIEENFQHDLSLPLDSVEVIEPKPQMLSNTLVPSRLKEGISDGGANLSNGSDECFTLDQMCLPLIFNSTTGTRCADWCDLPTELLYFVFEKLADDLNDLSSCARVCVLWCSIIDLRIKQLFPTPFMLLMYPAYDEDHCYNSYSTTNIPPNEGYYRLFNTRSGKTITTLLPQLCGRWLCSASHGWLLTSGDFPFEIKLLNPLTRAQIKLPRPWDGNDACTWNGEDSLRFFRVFTSSSTPWNQNSIVMGRYVCSDGTLGFCRPRDRAWSRINIGEVGDFRCSGDAIFFKGDFYVIYRTFLYRISVDESNLNATACKVLQLPRFGGRGPVNVYLVEMSGELLIIAKSAFEDRMRIYKLQVKGDCRKKWVRLSSLGGEHAIYLGFLNSVSVYVGKGNGSKEGRPNCVYYIDEDLWGKGRGHINVYNLDNKRFEKLDHSTLLWTTALNWFRF